MLVLQEGGVAIDIYTIDVVIKDVLGIKKVLEQRSYLIISMIF